MQRHATLRTALLCAAVPACLLLASCEPAGDSDAPVRPRYQAPLPVPRRAANPNPENAQWLAAWRDLRTQLAPLEDQLARAQKMHLDYHFDAFLELDPETIDKDQLCSLFHFLQRGYFTVEREVLLRLLERRLQRASTPMPIPTTEKTSLKDLLAAAMQRDELRMVDLESALAFYRQPGDDSFQIPATLTEEEEAELRTTVTDMLEETRKSVAAMDAKIEKLKAQVFGNDAAQNQTGSEVKTEEAAIEDSPAVE